MPEFGLGRLPAEDERDGQFRMAVPLEVELRDYRYYRTGPVLNQGAYPHCVGYAWRQFLSSAHLMSIGEGPTATNIYVEAQKIDEWPGENYDGTSVRGGAKYLQRVGRIGPYSWAWDATTIRSWLLSDQGTVVVGTNWYNTMFHPDGSGYLHPTGSLAGGHAYLIVGYSTDREAFRILNSWGREWGQSGRAWVAFEDMNRLISQDGEACTAIELVA